ncbi:ligase-associated DNA damage response endonuclease PdeM [Psychroserpens sp.]|uniref:ligase-associated DNA damage response endonuclease PdeM n=1 Tax=Psychroserpens sp. TaxID=2020870 RepID=UPI003C7943D4
MTFVEKHIRLQDEDLILNNGRVLFWEKEGILITSDIHIGKTAHFRRHGIPISSQVQDNDLKRLSHLIDYYQPNQLLVVGDLFHAELNVDMESFSKWRDNNPNLDISLIKGNHDRLKNEVFETFDIECCSKQHVRNPFKFIHEPDFSAEGFSISGHIHPGVVVQKKAPRIKLPCFQVLEHQLILPAFSEFTGLSIVKTNNKSVCHAFTETSFFEF